MQHLFKNYTTDRATNNGLLDLCGTTQKEGENEQEFKSRLDGIISRCGKVNPQHQVKTLFISVLIPEMFTLVEAFQERHRKVSYP